VAAGAEKGGADTTLPVDPPDWDARCDGTADLNGFYGDGVVNAEAAAGL